MASCTSERQWCSSHRQVNVNHTPSSTFQACYCYSVTEELSLSHPGIPNVGFNHFSVNSHHLTFQATSSLNVRRSSTNQTSAFYPDSISVCLVRGTVFIVSGDYIPNKLIQCPSVGESECNSTEMSPSWEANRSSYSKEISCNLWTRRLIVT
jgi:hypothetical protein